jgi:hypothetical protein
MSTKASQTVPPGQKTSSPGTPRAVRTTDPARTTDPVRSTDPVRAGVESPAQPLEGGVRATLEQQLGHDFSNIRIHAGPAAASSARSLNAEAFTVGRDVVFGSGRYIPSTQEGRRLLAHELAHVAHRSQAPQVHPGVAPSDASAERYADIAAEQVPDRRPREPGKTPASGHFRNWGAAWEVHRQVVGTPTKGAVQHTGEVGHLPGQIGVAYGMVEVRTGEEIELKGGAKVPNVIAVQYKGSYSADMKWLQFVWFELVATIPAGTARVTGNVPTTSGNKPFTMDPKAPDWSVDSASTTDPFYEASGVNLRDKTSTTIFDAPGGGSATPLADAVFKAGVGATSVTFTAHFEDYLIRTDGAVYVVGWQASTVFTQSKGATTAGAIGYTVGTSEQVTGLPKARQTLLATSYPKYKGIK